VLLLPEKDEALWQRIARLRQALWERKDTAVAQAGDLYRSLVAPAEDLLSGAQRLWIVAEGAVQLIPFAALPGRDGKYLAERMAVAYAPSLSLAVSRRVAPPGEADLSALVVAAPETGAAGSAGDRGMYMPIRGMYMPVRGAYIPIRGEGGVSTALTEMATMPLPGARAEGDSVARVFAGAQLLSGAEATKPRLLQEGSRCDILHIATHGYADPEVPEFSGLLLAGTGGKRYEVLTAQEVYLWPLRARLVTLSACQTGLGKNVEGEGLLGLTRAFIYAGAQDVLCSLWPVSDESTAKLMATFYAALRKGAAVEDALREAQLQLLQDPATRHPFYWAAFIPVRGPQ
jgi:CHAT domain-containing protein